MVAALFEARRTATSGESLTPVGLAKCSSQVGSNDYAEANAPDEKTAEDLRWLAQLGAKQSPPVKIAYESWCFSKRVASWEHTWKLVQMGVSLGPHNFTRFPGRRLELRLMTRIILTSDCAWILHTSPSRRSTAGTLPPAKDGRTSNMPR